VCPATASRACCLLGMAMRCTLSYSMAATALPCFVVLVACLRACCLLAVLACLLPLLPCLLALADLLLAPSVACLLPLVVVLLPLLLLACVVAIARPVVPSRTLCSLFIQWDTPFL
jgi:hypothetical protein